MLMKFAGLFAWILSNVIAYSARSIHRALPLCAPVVRSFQSISDSTPILDVDAIIILYLFILEPRPVRAGQ